MAQSEVLSGYDGILYLTTKKQKTSEFSITDSSEITIDNLDNIRELPTVTIKPTTSDISFNNISDGDSQVDLEEVDLSEDDELILDFKNQEYTLNGDNIISDLSFDNKRIALSKDTEQNIDIDCSGDFDITVEYKGYDSEEELSYVESFSLDYSVNTSHKRGYKSNKIIKTNLKGEEYNVNISKFTVSERFLQGILDGEEHRLRFDVDNPVTGDNITHTLLDVVFKSYSYGFTAPDEIMMQEIEGSAKDLIFNN